MKLPPATYIDTDSALRSLVPSLAGEPFVAIDTESNSLYAYRERVCLFQLSTRAADYIIDPLTIDDMGPLGAVLADPHTEKILHAAEYDIMSFKRDFGFTINNIFDTMLAARILGHRQVGLNAMLEKLAGIQTDKRHQRDNWGQRPLPDDSLQYAQMDTHFLSMVRNDLYDELVEQGRLAEAQDAFAELSHIRPATNGSFDPDGYWRIGRPKRLNRRQMAVLRELYLWREQAAEKRDCPPFKVFSNEVMIELARRAPQHPSELVDIRGISSSMMRRYGDSLMKVVERGTQARIPSPPAQPRRAAPVVMERYSALRDWRKARAQQRGVESDVIVSKNVLWLLAEDPPQSLADLDGIPGLGPWRLSTYGDELLAVLQKMG